MYDVNIPSDGALMCHTLRKNEMSKKNYRAGPNAHGRKPNPLSERFQFMMTIETRAALDTQAARRGVQCSELLRSWIDAEANQTELPL